MKKVEYYCDICKSKGVKNFKKFSIDERHPVTRAIGGMVGVQIYLEEYDVCNDCWEKIVDLIDELKTTKGKEN